jgi:hypothetical protein
MVDGGGAAPGGAGWIRVVSLGKTRTIVIRRCLLEACDAVQWSEERLKQDAIEKSGLLMLGKGTESESVCGGRTKQT